MQSHNDSAPEDREQRSRPAGTTKGPVLSVLTHRETPGGANVSNQPAG